MTVLRAELGRRHIRARLAAQRRRGAVVATLVAKAYASLMLTWQNAFDPNNRNDYAVDWRDELLATADELVSARFTLPDAAIAAGMRVLTSGVDASGAVAFMWITSADSATTAALSGQTIAVSHTVTTASGRTLHRSLGLKIKQA